MDAVSQMPVVLLPIHFDRFVFRNMHSLYTFQFDGEKARTQVHDPQAVSLVEVSIKVAMTPDLLVECLSRDENVRFIDNNKYALSCIEAI